MKSTILLLLASMILVGCATPSAPVCVPETIEVKVPVPVPAPQPPVLIRPQLAIYMLTDTDKQDPGKVAQYFEATVKQLIGYSIQLETILDGYRTKKDPAK